MSTMYKCILCIYVYSVYVYCVYEYVMYLCILCILCIYVYMNIWIYQCMYICTYVYMYICIYVYVYAMCRYNISLYHTYVCRMSISGDLPGQVWWHQSVHLHHIFLRCVRCSASAHSWPLGKMAVFTAQQIQVGKNPWRFQGFKRRGAKQCQKHALKRYFRGDLFATYIYIYR